MSSGASGQLAMADLTVHHHGDVVIAWNKTMLDAIRADKTSPGPATRTMAMVQAAIYDAVNDIDRTSSVYHVDIAAPPGSSPEAAASAAAYRVLVNLYPAQKARFDATLAESLATIPDGPTRSDGLAVGNAVADGILAWRSNDGSATLVQYTPGTAPGDWQPTPPDFSNAWGPEWGRVTPFAIPNASQFMPLPPPPLDSAAYTAAFNEVKSVGALDSTTRTPDQTQIGLFWAYDRPSMGPPPIRYNQIAETIALQQHNTLDQNARMFALVDIAMADAGIVAWGTKFGDNFWRPITAIRAANTDGNPATVADPNWTPLGAPGGGVVPDFTPPFPAYISGHATFGAALFRTLADFYGTDNISFTIGSDELPGVYRTFDSFSAAAEENGQSRIYLGIHWSFDKTAGIATGDAVADYVFHHELGF
ncbi:MAG: vanadium-dependent haloperoxidase [Planctomycetaceae bacterium]